jgi:alpha-glucosidase
MIKLLCYFLSFLLLFFSFPAWAADTTLVKSPEGSLVFKLYNKEQQLFFRVTYKDIDIINPSPLVLTSNGQPFTKAVTISPPKRIQVNKSYPVWGAHSIAIDKYNSAEIRLIGSSNLMASNIFEVRVFNDGVAFRHSFNPTKQPAVPDEATVFNLPSETVLWYHDMEMHYESVHVKKQIDEVSDSDWVAPPATFKLPQGIYASITEAALKNYPGMTLQANGKNGLVIRLPQHVPTNYPYRLRYSPEDTSRLKRPAAIKGKVTTPWRVILVGDLNALVNNDVITNLNDPPDPKLFPKGMNTDWIKPGRAVWKYLNGGGDGTLEVMKHFTDGAAALGFEHNILEGFWTRWTEGQLKELVNYSKEKGVGIWLWKHSKSLRDPASRDSFFRLCHDLGVAGAKLDFFDHEAREVIDLYSDVFREAAKYHVLLDFHGANKPTGLIRTYPHSLTYESVKGMESSRLLDRATHETTIPFTRLLAGPAEYTVVMFGDRRKNTTWAHQVASAAIFSAPLLTYAAHPDTLLASPAVEIIKTIPPFWDETIVLPGSEIGELAAFARRKGNSWFIAAMNGTQPKKLAIPLTFLKGNYKVLEAKDDESNSASIIMNNINYSDKDVIELDLAPGGGYIARFSK